MNKILPGFLSPLFIMSGLLLFMSSCIFPPEYEEPKKIANQNSIILINNSRYTIYSGNTNAYEENCYDEITLDKIELNIRLNKNGGTYTIENVMDGSHTLKIECWYYGQKVLDATQFFSLYGNDSYTLTIN